MEKELQVGDKIRVEPRIMKPYVLTVDRVTKTMAICSHPYNKQAKIRFRRQYSDPKWIRLINQDKWNTTDYELITKHP